MKAKEKIEGKTAKAGPSKSGPKVSGANVIAQQSGSEDTQNKLATMPSCSSKKSVPTTGNPVVESLDERNGKISPAVSQKKQLLNKAVMDANALHPMRNDLSPAKGSQLGSQRSALSASKNMK